MNQKIRNLKGGMTIREFSLKTDVNQFRLFNIIFNPFYNVKMTDGFAIAKAYGIKIADLI